MGTAGVPRAGIWALDRNVLMKRRLASTRRGSAKRPVMSWPEQYAARGDQKTTLESGRQRWKLDKRGDTK